MSDQSVEVKLELGHRATLRTKRTSEGYTHDWIVFVRGAENSNIQHFVDKVVFNLHDSFPKPRRVIKEPPYQVAESGYAGFTMPIDVYFRNKEEPKKVTYSYDLYLRLEQPVSNIRAEKLTFPNPPEEFRKKLLKAGGTKVKVTGLVNSTGVSSSSLTTHSSKTEHSGESKPSTKHSAKPTGDSHKEKKSKSHSNNKDVSKPASLPPPPPPPPLPQPRASQPFTDIFGTPIKTRPSVDTPKQKESGGTGKTISGGNKGGKHPPQSSSGSSGVVANPAIVMTSTVTKEHKSKDSSKSKESKATKRPASPNSSTQSSSGGKRKRTLSSSSVSNSTKSSEVPEKKAEASKEKTKDGREKKEKHKHKADGSSNRSTNSNNTSNNSNKKERTAKPSKTTTESKSKHEKSTKSHKKPSPLQPNANENKSASALEEKAATPEPAVESTDVPVFTPESKAEQDPQMGRTQTEPSSPASSGSMPSPDAPLKNGPLFAMMEEMEKESLSPLSSNPASPLEFAPTTSSKKKTQISYSDSEPEQPALNSVKSEEPKDEPMEDLPANQNGDIKDNNGSNQSQKLMPSDPDYLAELVDLQRRIMGLDDRRYLQRIVDVIEETGLYQITSSTFDFDLCTLDQKTVRKLQGCLAVK